MTSYSLKPLHTSPRARPVLLEFDWDAETGEINGPGADLIRDRAAWGEIGIQPHPTIHRFSADPLRNRTDMAAIIGYSHELPADLVEHYPQVADETADSDPDLIF